MHEKIITYLRGVIKEKKEKADEVRKQIKDAQTADEVRALGDTLQALKKEIEDAEEQLKELEKDDPDGKGTGDGSDEGDEGRGWKPEGGEMRNMGIIGAYGMGNQMPGADARADESGTARMEYRKAFMEYVQRGTKIPDDVLARAGGDKGTTISTDIGAIIPEPIMNEFIKDVSKAYGHIYAKVRKMNVQGGVKFPISKLKATAKWITETNVSDKQKAGDIKEFVTFGYNILEIRVAETLLAKVVSLAMFEAEITRIMVAAYLEAMDKGIVSGSGNGEMLGITKDPRVTKVVEMTAQQFADWTAWRTELFAKVPLSKRGQGEFMFPASTVETYLLTMKDENNRPLFREATDLSMGNTAGKFFGRNTDLVEPDVIKDFDIAEEGDVVGVFWVPQDYVINTNMEFGMRRYFDENTNEYINKGLTIVDGKILDASGCYLIKKKLTV